MSFKINKSTVRTLETDQIKHPHSHCKMIHHGDAKPFKITHAYTHNTITIGKFRSTVPLACHVSKIWLICTLECAHCAVFGNDRHCGDNMCIGVKRVSSLRLVSVSAWPNAFYGERMSFICIIMVHIFTSLEKPLIISHLDLCHRIVDASLAAWDAAR